MLPATSFRRCSSGIDSTLKHRMSCDSARRISSTRLADAGKNHLAGIAAGGKHAQQFAAGDDVEAGAPPRQQVEDGQVRVGLHGVAHQRVAAGAGIGVGIEIVQQRRLGIDVQGRAEGGGHAMTAGWFRRAGRLPGKQSAAWSEAWWGGRTVQVDSYLEAGTVAGWSRNGRGNRRAPAPAAATGGAGRGLGHVQGPGLAAGRQAGGGDQGKGERGKGVHV